MPHLPRAHRRGEVAALFRLLRAASA